MEDRTRTPTETQKGEWYLSRGRDLRVRISKSLGSDFHSDLRATSVLAEDW